MSCQVRTGDYLTLYTRFSETFDLRQLTQEFDQARGEIDPHALLPDAYVTELRRHALVQSVHYSTRIEGNTLSQDQVNSLMAGSVVGATTREVQEVQNYREALSYARRMFLDQTSPITSETLRTVHFLVSKGLDDRDYAPGHYRTAQNFVIDRYSHRRLYLPPPPDRLPGLMDELIEWINSREPLHPAYRAGLAHLNLVAIHPFSDGNGRTARVLETLVMYRHG
jgi:Fic family protein